MKIKMKKIAIKLPTKPKRFAAIVLLAAAILASIAYWIVRLHGTKQPVPASIPISTIAPVSATTALFGDRPDLLPSAASLSITGVIIAPDPQDSIAIVVEAGQRPRALRVGSAIAAGLRLAEVHPRYILVSDGERSTRISLPERAVRQTPSAAPDEPAVSEPDGGLRGEPPHRSGDQQGEPPGPATTP